MESAVMGRGLLCLICIMRTVMLTENTMTYVSPDGLTCIKCFPGTYLKDHCKENNVTSKCLLCPNGTYSSTPNQALWCAPCRQHCSSKFTVPVKPCTSTSNMECDCPHGTHTDQSYPKEYAPCILDKPCPAGHGVIHSDPTKGIIKCKECIHGETFSATISPTDRCQPCTKCEEQAIQTACNITQDLVCVPKNDSVSKVEHKPGIDSSIPVAVVMSVVVIVTIVLVILYVTRRNKNKKSPVDDNDDLSLSPPVHNENIATLPESSGQGNGNSETRRDTPEVTESPQPNHSTSRSTQIYTQEQQLQRQFSFISHEIELRWKEFMRHLLTESGSDDADGIVQRVKMNNEGESTQEKAYRCLMKWKELYPESVNREHITATFRHYAMRKSLKSFEKKFPSSTGDEQTAL